MDSTKNRILEEKIEILKWQNQKLDLEKCCQVGFSCFLKSHNGGRLKPYEPDWNMSIIINTRKVPKILNIARHICSYFSNKPVFRCDRLQASQCSNSSIMSLPREGQFGDETISGLLIFPDLSQGLVPWSELPRNCRLFSCHLKR